MKKENTDLSRRNFLTKGTAAAVAAGASIIAIPATSPMNVSGATGTTPMLTNDPVYTESVQTLSNKTISSQNNTLGTDAINVREFSISGSDITSALNSALTLLGSYPGGQILIPHGTWETNGGHVVPHSVSIEGVGFNTGVTNTGTMIKLKTGQSSFMFKLLTDRRNVSFKNLGINLNDTSSATGILMTNNGCTAGGYESCGFVYNTCIENVGIYGGAYGIKVDSISNTQFECILNRFERVSFIGCTTAFYCNTVNSGFTFDNCHFYIPGGPSATGGTALNCYVVGNISLEHCLFVGVGFGANQPVTDGSTILKTTGNFNNISFYDCQDEGLQYAYQNSTNHWDIVSIVFRSCLIQSHFKFTAHGNITLDGCRCSGTIYDSSSAVAKIFLKGVWNYYTSPTVHSAAPLTSFVNAYSQVVYENLEVGAPVVKGTGVTGTQSINASRGAVNIASGTSWVQVYNNLVRPDSLIFLQLRTYDSGGARIREVYTATDYFVIYLTQNAATELSIGFIIEG